MALMLALALILTYFGSVWGMVLHGFIIAMIVVWAVTDFCPSIWFLRKTIGSCQ